MIEEIWKDVIYGPVKKGMYEAYWVGISNKFFKDEYKLEFYSEKFNDYRN